MTDDAAHNDAANLVATTDSALDDVVATLRQADPYGRRAAAAFRATFDQLYDGQHTGRYHWEQLSKTEKTHYGTLIEINLRREFADIIDDGADLDYRINGHDIDCKFSFKESWMLPPECFDHILLVCSASDEKSSWSIGFVRATKNHRRIKSNRDEKTGLNDAGRQSIRWVHRHAELPPNILLQIEPWKARDILSRRSGQQRLNELFRQAQNRRIGRNVVATVAQQDDYMKRVRANGGSRTTLAKESYLIPGGDYENHRIIAAKLGKTVPDPGEFVSFKVAPATTEDNLTVEIDGRLWRAADPDEPTSVPAPALPTVKKRENRNESHLPSD